MPLTVFYPVIRDAAGGFDLNDMLQSLFPIKCLLPLFGRAKGTHKRRDLGADRIKAENGILPETGLHLVQPFYHQAYHHDRRVREGGQ